MISLSNNLPSIAVLRGGKIRREDSLLNGGEILRSLTGLGYIPLDIVIDRDSTWTMKGVPTDAHYVYTCAEYIVDTTHDREAPYKTLAKKMGVHVLLSHDDTVTLDRETMYRLLHQQGIPTPKTFVVRAHQPLQPTAMKNLWQTFHTPLMVRPLSRDHGHTSKLIRKFADLQDILHIFQKEGVDSHVLTYTQGGTISLAVLPSFRGQELYTSLSVQTFVRGDELPHHVGSIRAVLAAGDEKNQAVRDVVEKAYDALGLVGHAVIDIIPYNDTYMVVNVDTRPSFHKEGRFMQSLATTGIDIGQYIHIRIQHEGER